MMRLEQVPQQTYAQMLRIRINYLLREIDVEFAEILTVWVTLACGVVLLLPGDTFAVARGFDTMAMFPDWAWGLWLFVMALVQGWALVFDRPRVRKWAAAIIFGTWLIVDSAFQYAAWRAYHGVSFGAVLASSIWLSAMWAYLRLGKPRRVPHGLEFDLELDS